MRLGAVLLWGDDVSRFRWQVRFAEELAYAAHKLVWLQRTRSFITSWPMRRSVNREFPWSPT